MNIELWKADSGNLIGQYAGLDQLGQVLRDLAELNGPHALDDLFAEVWTASAESEPVASWSGDALRQLATTAPTYVYDYNVPTTAGSWLDLVRRLTSVSPPPALAH